MNKQLKSRRNFLKSMGLSFAALTLPRTLTIAQGASYKKSNLKPNIIFILADDLGWADVGCYGNDFNETSNIDKLAKQGMRFTNAYAPAPVCSPTRGGLLTGQYPARFGITDYLRPNGSDHLSTDQITIAGMLKKAGYATGMVGKWHLSGYCIQGAPEEVRATDFGFDEELFSEIKGVGNGADFYPYVFRDQKISWLNVEKKRLPGKEYLVDRMNLEAVDFIDRQKDRPFFLYLSHYAVHTILNGKENLVMKYIEKHRPGKSSRNKCYLCQDAGFEGDPLHHWAKDHNPHFAAMLESIDDGVGMIMNKLNELGLADNTIFIFTSDNGGETNVTSNAPLRGGKSSLYEGGIREPLIIRWPGVVPANMVCHKTVNIVDFYPTLLQAANIEPDKRQKLDGISIVPVLKNPTANLKREALYWHYPLEKPHFLGGRSSGAIRLGDWKLIEFFDTGEIELYNLAEDISEKDNLATKYPNKKDELLNKLINWRKNNNIIIPPDCAKYNPALRQY